MLTLDDFDLVRLFAAILLLNFIMRKGNSICSDPFFAYSFMSEGEDDSKTMVSSWASYY